jgi:hypothetical protein
MGTNIITNGPQVGQIVLYNNGGVKVPAIIYSANASTWAISALYIDGLTTLLHNITAVAYDPNFGTSTWRYAPIF